MSLLPLGDNAFEFTAAGRQCAAGNDVQQAAIQLTAMESAAAEPAAMALVAAALHGAVSRRDSLQVTRPAKARAAQGVREACQSEGGRLVVAYSFCAVSISNIWWPPLLDNPITDLLSVSVC